MRFTPSVYHTGIEDEVRIRETNLKDAAKWCYDHKSENGYYCNHPYFYFENKEDAIWFALQGF